LAPGFLYLSDYQYHRKSMVPTPLEKPETWNPPFRNYLIHRLLQNERFQPCQNLGERRESPPVPERESLVEARLIRVYGVVNLYLTFLEDLFEVYLIGVQVDMGRP